MDYKPAPGLVLCKVNPDIEEEMGMLVPGGRRSNWAEVIKVGERPFWEKILERLGGSIRLKKGDQILLPSVKQLFADGQYACVRKSEIRVKL